VTSDVLSDYDVLQPLRLRSARVHQISTPPVPVSIARRLAELDLVVLPALPETHYLDGSVQFTDCGQSELNRRFLFCCAEQCDGILHDWRKEMSELVSARNAKIGDRLYLLNCPECGATNVLSASAHPIASAQITRYGVLPSSALIDSLRSQRNISF
jgi:hypothetical protein